VQGWAVSVAVLTSQYYNIIRRGLIRLHVFVYERASFTTALHVIQDTRLLPAGIQPSICIGTFSYSYKIHKKWVRVWQRVHRTIRSRVSRDCIHAFPLPRKINRQISNCKIISGLEISINQSKFTRVKTDKFCEDAPHVLEIVLTNL
jgi:hypothetical protein